MARHEGCQILASEEAPISTGTDGSGSLFSQLSPLMAKKPKKPTALEGFLPWRRDRSNYNGTNNTQRFRLHVVILLLLLSNMFTYIFSFCPLDYTP